MCRATIRRSGHRRRETSGPPEIHCAEPKSPRGVHASQGARGAGNERGAGARDWIGWQTSVRRIARLLCRSIARSLGSKRALAGRKFVAPPDAERGWIKGETVRLVRGNSNRAPRIKACRFRLARSNTKEGVSGLLPAVPSPARRSRVLRLSGQRAQCRPARVVIGGEAHRADSESDSGVSESDHGNVRGRHGSVTARQDPRRIAAGQHPRR